MNPDTFTADSSNGQDSSHRRRRCGFESRVGGHFHGAIAQRSETAGRDTSGDEGSSPSGFTPHACVTQRTETALCAKSGDAGSIPAAGTTFEQFEQQYRPLLFKLANRWTRNNPGLDEKDLLQVGRLAMWKCWQRFDASRNVTFFHFCLPWVSAALSDHVWRIEHVVRIPWERWRERKRLRIAHMDADDDTRRLVERQACPQPGADCDGMRTRVNEVLATLRPRAREAVTLYFFKSVSTREIARRRGVSHQAVSEMIRLTLVALKTNAALLALKEEL